MLRSALLKVSLALVSLGCLRTPAEAGPPLPLTDEASVQRLADMMLAYRGASRVRWVIDGSTAAERKTVLEMLAGKFGAERDELMERIVTRDRLTNRTLTAAADSESTLLAYMAIGAAPETPCSWRVTVSDDLVPARARWLKIPLENGDRIPVSATASFEVGFSGPLQSTLYAFGETKPGAIRDLAAAPELAIPAEAGGETLILVRARRSVPFLDAIKTALSDTPGQRDDLGENASLANRFIDKSRGIGTNIQLVDPGMIVAQADSPPPTPAVNAPEELLEELDDIPVARLDDLAETCVYSLTPSGSS